MSGKMEPIGILFELQWKKKSEDVANIGIWDTPDASLDWMTFKSYLCQNLGTMEDIHVAYVDSDGDELPIESECEFQEALKFARQRASKGKQVVLKVERNGIPLRGNQTAENIKKSCSFSKMMTDSEKNAKQKQCKIHFKSPERTEFCTEKVRGCFSLAPQLMSVSRNAEEKKLKFKKSVLCSDYSKLISGTAESSSKKDDLKKKAKLEKEECPPIWFKKYMQKMKKEIVAEVTAAVTSNTKQILELAKASNNNAGCCSCGGAKGEICIGTKNKKKSSDEDSSDGNLSNDQRDHKLLKKIEKLQKREKKLEKKLDSKLEKLENKTKRRMEKKSQSKARSEPPCEKKHCSGSKKRSGDGPVGTYLMDAILLSNGPKPTSEMHIKLGEKFTKVWTIMNNGTLPWTDKTELRLAWGTLGLEPEETVVKCPILEPGEKGQIAVNFRAPEIPGTFESYWHFYHMGDRFGHWLGCAVVVDPKEPEQSKKNVMFVSSPPASSPLIDVPVAVADDVGELIIDKEIAVDLTVKAKPEFIETVTVEAKNDKSGEVSNESSEDKNVDRNESTPYSIQKDPEYYSDSDDDNLSVISGTISLSSNSEEEEENFVVVPLPACFICEVPLESADAQTNSEELKTELETTKGSDANQSSDNSEREPKAAVKEAATAPTVEAEAEACFSADTSNTFAHSSAILDMEHHQRADIYAVDVRGHCVPVEAYKPKQQQREQRNNTGKHNESNSSPRKDNETRGTFNSWQKFSSKGNAETFNTGIPNSNRFHFYTASSPPQQYEDGEYCCHHITVGSTHSSSSSSSSSQNNNATSSQTSSSASPQDKTDQHGDGEYCCHHITVGSTHSSSSSSSSQNNNATSSQTSSSASPQDKTDQHGASVHILPEGLVSGVIDVASQAYSTAKTVLSNLRPRPDAAENANGGDTWTRVPERSTSENLEVLLEMGFKNRILNVLLLERYQNDLEKVVAELLLHGKSGRGR